jgi:hypothetical protein
LPFIAALLVVGWVSWGAESYWVGHFGVLTGGVGAVGSNVQSGLTDRIHGADLQRSIVLALRIGFTGIVFAAALTSAYSQWRDRRTPWLPAALLLAPIPVVALQAYGGELLLRLFLFSVPFASILIAGWWDEDRLAGRLSARRFRRSRVALVVVACLATPPLFIVARYGNESYEQTFPGDLAVVDQFYRVVPHHSLVLLPGTSSPYRVGPFSEYRWVVSIPLYRQPRRVPHLLAQAGVTDAYVLVTRSSIAEAHYADSAPTNWARLLDETLRDTPGVTIVARSGPAVLYHLHTTRSAATTGG